MQVHPHFYTYLLCLVIINNYLCRLKMLNNALPPKKEVSSIIHFLKKGEYAIQRISSTLYSQIKSINT